MILTFSCLALHGGDPITCPILRLRVRIGKLPSPMQVAHPSSRQSSYANEARCAVPSPRKLGRVSCAVRRPSCDVVHRGPNQRAVQSVFAAATGSARSVGTRSRGLQQGGQAALAFCNVRNRCTSHYRLNASCCCWSPEGRKCQVLRRS